MIFDTNALSAFANGDRSLLKILSSSVLHHLPVIVLGEYRYGLKRSRERIARERWLDELESIFDVLNVNNKTAREYAKIREELRSQGNPIPENDLWIAAMCREKGLALLSKDQHFDNVTGLERREW